MPVCFGPVISKKLKNSQVSNREEIPEKDEIFNYCFVCKDLIEKEKELKCLADDCDLVSHIICLSKYFLTPGEYVPVEGTCPKCDGSFLWGEIIRKYKGCYANKNNAKNTCNYSSDSDSD